MTRPTNDSPRQPLIESLESRHLFAAATPLPDLSAVLAFTAPAVLQPGSNIAPTLKITNNGAAMAKQTYVPLRIFVSPTRTLKHGAVPFKVIQQPLNLDAGASTTVTLTSTLPTTKIKTNKYFLIVQVNNGRSLAESDATNNTVVSSPLTNPAGTYHGKFTSSDGHPGTLTLDITNAAASSSAAAFLLTDFTSVSDGIRFHVPHLKSNISSTGAYQVVVASDSFHHPTLGHLFYRLTLNATLTGNTLSGTFQLHWQSRTASHNATSTFSITRA